MNHNVTVTPLGPRWHTECLCGMPERRFASQHAANLHGIRHLESVGAPLPPGAESYAQKGETP